MKALTYIEHGKFALLDKPNFPFYHLGDENTFFADLVWTKSVPGI